MKENRLITPDSACGKVKTVFITESSPFRGSGDGAWRPPQIRSPSRQKLNKLLFQRIGGHSDAAPPPGRNGCPPAPAPSNSPQENSKTPCCLPSCLRIYKLTVRFLFSILYTGWGKSRLTVIHNARRTSVISRTHNYKLGVHNTIRKLVKKKKRSTKQNLEFLNFKSAA